MTIASTTSKVSYNGSGSTGPFPITYKFTKNADIAATKRSSAGVETVLTLTTDYTLTGAGDASGGALTLVTALAVGESLVIARVPGIVQEVDYVENSAFPAETHEGALDLLTMICQSLQEQVDRSVKVEISSTTNPDDLLAEIAVDVASAEAAAVTATTQAGIATAAAASIPTFGAFGFTLAGTPTASNARTSLGLGSAAVFDVGTGANNIVQLDSSAKLPAIDGSQLTNIPASSVSSDLPIRNAIKIGILSSDASGPAPSSYMYLFQTDEVETKTNATYISSSKLYANRELSATKYALTSGMFTVGGGWVLSSGAALINGTTGTNEGGYISSGAAVGSALTIDLGTSVALGKLRIFRNAATAPYGIKAQYSDDNFTWADASSPMTLAVGWNDFTWSSIIGAHRYWQFVTTIIADSANQWCSEVEAYAYGTATNITLVSWPIAAGTSPEKVDLYILHTAVDTVTLNTDLKARVTLNGADWSAYGTLEDLGQYDANFKLLHTQIDTSGLSSPVNIKWEITTYNNKEQRIRAAALVFG